MGAQDRKSNTAVTFGMRNRLVFGLTFTIPPFYKENYEIEIQYFHRIRVLDFRAGDFRSDDTTGGRKRLGWVDSGLRRQLHAQRAGHLSFQLGSVERSSDSNQGGGGGSFAVLDSAPSEREL